MHMLPARPKYGVLVKMGGCGWWHREVRFSSATLKPEEWEEAQYPEPSTSWGLLDLAYRTPDEIWVSGGSICYVVSMVARLGKKTVRLKTFPQFYKIVFSPEQGFIIGQDGVLLKYQAPTEAA